MKLTATNISLIAINTCFIWVGLQTTIANGIDGKARLLTLFLFTTLAANLLANNTFKKQFFNKYSPLLIWLVWFLYAVINTAIQYTPTPKTGTALFISSQLFFPFIILTTIASIRADRINQLLQTLQFSLYVFFTFVFLYAGFSGGRLSLERFDPNELSLYVYALISVIGINYFLSLQSYKKSLLLMVPVLFFSILLGSRMGFVGTAVLILGFLLVTKKSAFSLKRILILTPIAILVLMYVFNETTLGERLLSTTSQTEAWQKNPAEGTIFQYYGDRGVYYVLGWQAFLDAPIFGIGLQNFQNNYYYTVLHSEIMVQLAELGSIGFFLFLTFLYKIIKTLRNRIKTYGSTVQLYRYLSYPGIVLLFASTNLFLYKSFAVALLAGLIILLCREDVVFLHNKTQAVRR